MGLLQIVGPADVHEAVSLLADGVPEAPVSVLGGATWLMRNAAAAPMVLVDITALDGIREMTRTQDALRIGAAVTHSGLAQALADDSTCAGLRHTASRSANPNIRHQRQ